MTVSAVMPRLPSTISFSRFSEISRHLKWLEPVIMEHKLYIPLACWIARRRRGVCTSSHWVGRATAAESTVGARLHDGDAVRRASSALAHDDR